MIVSGRIMPRSKGRINPPKRSKPGTGPNPRHRGDARNLLSARTNRARAGQIAALLLVDFDTVDIR
jgi:hypothetical protein